MNAPLHIEEIAVEIFGDDIWLVGGAVRDEIMGKQPTDYDFATPLMPDEIEARIKAAGKHAYTVGKRFGTVGFRHNGQIVEVTTFRSEKYKAGCRKPLVNFVSDLESDLSRRDFTINAMAKHVNTQDITDPFCGNADILDGLIRCVGKPNERFKEDPLRLLRACRFAAQTGFAIWPTTLESMTNMPEKILQVSRERWGIEMDKLLVAAQPQAGLMPLMTTHLMKFVLPELAIQFGYQQNSPYHAVPDLWWHTMRVVSLVPPDIDLGWAALLHDVAKPFCRRDKETHSTYVGHDLVGAEMVRKIAAYWRWSNQRTETVFNLVLNHLADDSPLKTADNFSKKV